MEGLSVFEPSLANRLAGAGLKRFEDFWNLEWNWVEPRNERRNGWSGATRVCVETAEGPLSLFVKRQENHCYRSLRHPFRGRPTFYREWINIRRLHQIDVPTIDPVYYGERMHEGRYQAVLASVALDDFRDLDELFRAREQLSDSQRVAALKTVADLFVRMHQGGVIHNCLGGNHLMLRMSEGNKAEARLLDLEKVKQTRATERLVGRELARFIRHTPTLSPQDHLNFMIAYGDASSILEARQIVTQVNSALHNKHVQHGRRKHEPIKLD